MLKYNLNHFRKTALSPLLLWSCDYLAREADSRRVDCYKNVKGKKIGDVYWF